MRALWLAAAAVATVGRMATSVSSADVYEEDALIRPLPEGRTLVQVQFKITDSADILRKGNLHVHMFPMAVAQIMAEFQVKQFQLSLTQGFWDASLWGYAANAAPAGAELFAVFAGDGVDALWKGFSHAMSGLFCASLNKLGSTKTVASRAGFQGHARDGAQQTRYGALPRESVCTDNLTPWKKLLPCQTSAGLAQLLRSRKLYGTDYHSISTKAVIKCPGAEDPYSLGCADPVVELVQTLTVVVGGLVPAPYPFSFSTHLGVALTQACPVAARSRVVVELSRGPSAPEGGANKGAAKREVAATAAAETGAGSAGYTPALVERVVGRETVRLAVFDIAAVFAQKGEKGAKLFDPVVQVAAPSADEARPKRVGEVKVVGEGLGVHHARPTLRATRFITSTGREWDSIVTELTNDEAVPVEVTLTQVIPWFLHIYTHTLTATAGEGNGTRPVEVLRSSYKPSVARTSAHLWELSLLLPGEQRTTLKVDFERGYLRYSEYPADPYRGFEVPAAVIEGNLAAPHANSEGPAWVHLVDQSSDQGPAARAGRTVRIHTEAMNVQMPSPDFSMPYNVISISSTIIAISFGVFFKAGVYQTIPTPPDAPAPPGLFQRVKARLAGSSAA